jgi:putative acetyltransferase
MATEETIEIAQGVTQADIAVARELMREYGASLGIDLSYQNFDSELRDLPGDYAPPRGALLLARNGEECLGCIAMRPLAADICEMKRLYVRPKWRAHGTGRKLIDALFAAARAAGYRTMRLDTLPTMTAARALYKSLGFRSIAPYYDCPIEGTAFLELDLAATAKCDRRS